MRTLAYRSVTIPSVHSSANPLDPLDPDVRERLIEAARLATVGRLVASFVHQISTPLAAISLRAESLEHSASEASQPAAAGKALRYVRAIGEEASRCRELLAALREFGGPLDERAEPIELAKLCRSAVLLARDEAARRQVELELRLDESPAAVHGVRGRLGQLVLALLVNAVEASPAGARVVLEVRSSEQDGVVLSVSDEGAGIPRELEGRLFEPFTSSRAPQAGLGLGLMACRAVAEAHGGTLEARAEGEGGRVEVWLPLAPVRSEVPPTNAGA
jgi:signal transduction histidine kinase